MSLVKVTYTDHQTVITAQNLNDIQDEIINKCVTVDSKTFTTAQKQQARANIGLPTSGAVCELTYTVVSTF